MVSRRSLPPFCIVHSACLQRRLQSWANGDLNELVAEGRALQLRIPKKKAARSGDDRLARSFAQLMFHGKTKAALRLLANNEVGTPLHLDEMIDTGASSPKSVREILVDKHPPGMPANTDSIIDDRCPISVHPVVFESLVLGQLLCTPKDLLGPQE